MEREFLLFGGESGRYQVSINTETKRQFALPSLGFVLSLSIGGLFLLQTFWLQSIPAQAQGFWGSAQNSIAYQGLPDVENQLYGHAYSEQSLGQRITRVEKTLFGGNVHGPLEARMQRINTSMQQRKSQQSESAQEPMLTYLEDKLFQRTFPEKNLTDRIRQLEVQVFGRAFDNYPQNIRLKKLTYAMPLMAREIRLTKGDTVIARSSRISPNTYRTGAISETVQLDIRKPPSTISPETIKARADDYFAYVHRGHNGNVLRWSQLPIKVYSKPNNPEVTLTKEALQAWQTAFSVESTSQIDKADVIISWDKGDWEQNPSTLLTRPTVRLSSVNSIRTVVTITLYPARNLPPEQQVHVIAHQLGHAFGIWGHSDNAEDLMYPAHKLEVNDFPTRLRWRSSPDTQPSGDLSTQSPTQRDINTLLRVYDQPANDLSAYSPY